MGFTQFCVVLVIVPIAVVSQQLDPCGEWKAQRRRCVSPQLECRLVEQLRCKRPPCPPQPKCVPKRLRVSACRIGEPVLDVNYNPLSCFPSRPGRPGRECPYHTTCNTEVQDTQTTCCWSPSPGPAPFDPCIATLCPTGTRCEARPSPPDCSFGPCGPIGVCIDIAPPPPPKPVDPCATVLCREGYRCEPRATPCARPGPCPLVGVCIRNTIKEGQCPTGLTGPPDRACEDDSECSGNKKCCKHRSGTICATPVLPTPEYPCNLVDCPIQRPDCRLREVTCVTSPCPPLPVCLPRRPVSNQCPVGNPVLDANNNEIFCGRGFNRRSCPDGTFCRIDPLDRFAVCCHGSSAPPPSRPCDNKKCPPGEECREQTIFCFKEPCPPPTAVCRPRVKPGSCPRETLRQTGPCNSRCSTDADCSGNSKCCGTCQRRCKAPTKPAEKPGSCPLSTLPGQAGICLAKCSTDSECPGDQKCCGNCPRECRDPVPPKPKEKPGSCPLSTLPGQGGICIAKCSTDSECPRDQKCCGNCPRECRDPAPPKPKEKPGRCPVSKNGLVGICIARCTTDAECPGIQKCCGGCPRECKNPVTGPPKPSCATVKCGPGEECRQDTIRCVRAPCPQPKPECRLRVKPGSCPREAPFLTVECNSRCDTDADCSGNLKCCGRCNRQCRPPAATRPPVKPGKCPAPIPGQIGPCVVRCFGDTDCPGAQKCCGSCPKDCANPVIAPPPPKPSCATVKCGPGEECRQDTRFCIRAPCPQPKPECRRRIKPGSCPRETLRQTARCNSRCETDADCSRNLKCCGRCNRRCRPPVTTRPTEKPGKCPAPIPGQIGICVARCSRDTDCPGSQKCCGNCPRDCTNPVTAPPSCATVKCGPGEECRQDTIRCVRALCPQPKPECRRRIKPGSCPRETLRQTAQCNSRCKTDADCSGNLKCCGRCKRCKPPAPTRPIVKPGKCPAPVPGQIGICVARCSRDTDCPGAQKCCGNCPRDCTNPVTDTDIHPGTCPPVYGYASFFYCAVSPRCRSDGDCDDYAKCCPVGRCGARCLRAQIRRG